MSTTARMTSTTPELKHLLRTAREHTEKGQGRRSDWLRIAQLDPDLAQRELRASLKHALPNANLSRNPLEASKLEFGAGIGFAVGAVIMFACWLIAPPLRDQVEDVRYLPDIITALQFASSSFPVILAWIGARRRRQSSPDDLIGNNASFDELLNHMDVIQGRHHTRIY